MASFLFYVYNDYLMPRALERTDGRMGGRDHARPGIYSQCPLEGSACNALREACLTKEVLTLFLLQWTGDQLIGFPGAQFWSDLYALEITSNECLSKLRSILGCPTKIAATRRFQGNDAETFVNFLDKVGYLRVPLLVGDPIPRVHRFSHTRTSMSKSVGDAYDSFPRYAKPRGSFLPHIFFAGSSYALGLFRITVASQK